MCVVDIEPEYWARYTDLRRDCDQLFTTSTNYFHCDSLVGDQFRSIDTLNVSSESPEGLWWKYLNGDARPTLIQKYLYSVVCLCKWQLNFKLFIYLMYKFLSNKIIYVYNVSTFVK